LTGKRPPRETALGQFFSQGRIPLSLPSSGGAVF
jgi:hypothetical protein